MKRTTLLTLTLACLATATARGLEAIVEIEEEVYHYEPANNGAGPMWCSGSTCLARLGDQVYATGLETIPGAKPLNNCRWVLWRRDAKGWQRVFADAEGRTREPAPMVRLAEDEVWVSANPTLNPPEKEGGGAARPEMWRFSANAPQVPRHELPVWQGAPRFSEHSYRSFVSDASAGELLVFQNIDYTHAEWAFRDSEGHWIAQGQLPWPWGADYAKPQPIRVCYPDVALRGRAVHFFGVSDVVEPNPAWRAFKRELTGREWDYDFRRLFYTWARDVTAGGSPFQPWIEIASREKTCGGASPCDLWLAADGAVHLLWTERAIDERLRARFFPEAKQSHSLNHAVIRDGKVTARGTLLESTEDQPGPVVGAARFHPLSDGRLLVVCYLSESGGSGNRLFVLGADGTAGARVPIAFSKPFTSFFTATPRAGSAPSEVVDLLGTRAGVENAICYGRLRIR